MADHLTIYNAHNGESIVLAKPVRYHTLQSFKDFLLESFTKYTITSHENIFLLTSFGMKLNYAMVNEMTDIYVFDKRLFNSSRDTALVSRYLSNSEDDNYMLLKPTTFSVPEAPSNVKAYSSALRNYESWVNARLVGASRVEESIEHVIRHINTIFKSLSVVFQFAANFISGMEKSFDGYFAYVKALNMKSLHKAWEVHYSQLKEFPLLSFKQDGSKSLALVDFLDQESLKDAAAFIDQNLPRVVDSFNQFSSTVNKINSEKLEVDTTIEDLRKESITSFKTCESSRASHSNELASIGKRVRSELETATSSNTSDLQQVYSKQMAVASDIYSRSLSLFELLESLYSFKTKLVHQSLSIFENIASLQMRTVTLKTDMKKMLSPSEKEKDIPNGHESPDNETIEKIREAGDLLSLTVDLPLLFGFLLIEKRRQFEWHDFYSKGIVSNISEQLTVLIEHEKAFQKLWLKKFGGFLKFLAPEKNFRIQLPTIDVTLVNGDFSKRNDAAIEIIEDVLVEREDITNFIGVVKGHSPSNGQNFARLLEKNFKDLVTSTDSLKRVTRVVSSLGSLSPEQSQIITRSQVLNGNAQKPGNVTDDFDLNLIRGLRSRISKLEGLLHQQQYKNISNWPVVKSSDKKTPQVKDSLLVEDQPRAVRNPSSGDPTSLLLKAPSSRRTSSSNASVKAMDASTTIDKHVDNIRLRKEVNELRASHQLVYQDNESLRKALDESKREAQEKDFQLRQMQQDYEEKLGISEAVIKDLGNKHAEEMRALADRNHSELEQIEREHKNFDQQRTYHESVLDENKSLKSKLSDLEKKLEEKTSQAEESQEYRARFESLKGEFNDLQEIKQELLSNMHAKEAEYATERSHLETEIKNLTQKFEEKSEDYEDLMEVTQTKHHKSEEIINQLNNVVEGLFSVILELSQKNFEDFKEFCYVLESMGLLLVKESDSSSKKDEYKVRRVKGLRSRKGSEDETGDSIVMSDPKLHSSVVSEVENGMDWRESLRRVTSGQIESIEELKSNGEAEKEEMQAGKLIEVYYKLFEDSQDGSKSQFAQFLKLISFNEDIQLQLQDEGNTMVNQKFFLNGIFKRFKDVEGFAKKLSKENKTKQQEIAKLSRLSAGKITVNNFQAGDLVLFLPTHVDRVDGNNSSKTPWTAFNIEAPNYFLDTTKAEQNSNRDWIVSD
ncbi:hypothetical protein CXQ85_000028 [Candidozyma haemuli]|uniref:Autophagy-related protein 11 n=1 Tax=Candidozyma haemuli TaxID=45357 RepID=A0A2V1AUS0_9ASCO|nr:hypothetical protein CXQ85_000028 [[Candida] haemuloni]PVH21063.1 hypothetical protein CXQ85_000028 [[Candida] haemuloni]